MGARLNRVPKVAETPTAPVYWTPDDLARWTGPVWRIHRVGGRFPRRWDEFRTAGPLATMRWDPHDPARPGRSVMYVAADLPTACAEVYQDTRDVDTRDREPHLVSWRPTRPLELLDLTGTWPLRYGGAHALGSAPTTVCRAWARAVVTADTDLDGVLVRSTMTGRPMPVLFAPAASAVPPTAAFARPLDAAEVYPVLREAARETGYLLDGLPTGPLTPARPPTTGR